jgi:hypothetical protein
MVGSTLDGGPDWADGGGSHEVHRGDVVTVMHWCRTGIALPVLSPTDVLDMPTLVAGFDDGNHRSATTNCDPYQPVL